MEDIFKKTEAAGVIPVIKLSSPEQALPLGRALLEGGISVAEVTFRSPAAAKSIEIMSRELPEMTVIAGTVLTAEQAQLAIACGAKAVVSPGTNMKVVDCCRKAGVPVCPGVATPTEIEAALEKGLKVLKLFPAEAIGGVKLLKALYGPYAGVKFMPTGGISVKNLADYLSLPNVLCCGGSWLCPADALQNGDWERITALSRECRQLVGKIKGKS